MKIIRNHAPDEKLNFTVNFSTSTWKKIIKQLLADFAAKQKVKGFRTGKAPIEKVQEKISSAEILQQAELVGATKAIKFLVRKESDLTKGYRIFSRSTQKISNTEASFIFRLEKLPSIKIAKYIDLNFPRPEITVSKIEFEAALQAKRVELATFLPKKTAVMNGDQVFINFTGKLGEKNLVNSDKKNHSLIIGSKTMIPGFEEGLIGCLPESKTVLNLTFPETYTPELKGKKVTFSIEIIKVKTIIPATDEELINRWKNATVNNVNDFTILLKEQIKKQKTKQTQSKLIQNMMLKIVEDAEFVIPISYLTREITMAKKQEIETIKQKTGKTFSAHLKATKKTEKQFDEELKPEIDRMIREGLIIHKIAELENILVTKEDLDKYYEFLHNYTQKTVVELEKIYPRSHLENHFLRYKVENFLLKVNPKQTNQPTPSASPAPIKTKKPMTDTKIKSS